MPKNAAPISSPLLNVSRLSTSFISSDGLARAVTDVSFALEPRKTLGIVGESGSGKSVTVLSILGLLPSPPAQVEAGEAWFKGQDLLKLNDAQLRHIRGKQISMIFQEPMTALNPVFSVGAQIAEVFRLHEGANRRQAWDRAVAMLDKVRIPAAASRARDYPHQLSGGMRQRAMIAQALACNPDLIIADEPTTALDVTVQAQILDLIQEMQEQMETSVIMITHDLGVIAETADHTAVMYAGEIVEKGPTDAILREPAHPYTQGLLRSTPQGTGRGEGNLTPIEGNVPSPMQWPEGCRFHPRCPHGREKCRQEHPALESHGPQRECACHFKDVLAESPLSQPGALSS